MEILYDVGTRVIRNEKIGIVISVAANQYAQGYLITYKVQWDDGLVADYCAYGIEHKDKIPRVSNFVVLKEMHFSVWSTGGNCQAFGLKLEPKNKESAHVLITAVDGPSLPEPFDTKVLFGIYNNEGEGEESTCKEINTFDLRHNIEYALQKYKAHILKM